ncbi:hypothetical protein HanHA300_Chr12g0432081 [Helianthus annuus]|nr:hypothetical protein HanHA300_Chr12g0432081 [Helianthus annuus]
MASASNQRNKQKKEKEVIMVTDSDSEEPFTSESIDWDAPEPNIIWMPSSCSRFVTDIGKGRKSHGNRSLPYSDHSKYAWCRNHFERLC